MASNDGMADDRSDVRRPPAAEPRLIRSLRTRFSRWRRPQRVALEPHSPRHTELSSWPADAFFNCILADSPKAADRAFVESARDGSVATVVDGLHRATSVNTVVRVQPEGWPATALHLAAANANHEVVRILLAAGADPTLRMPTMRALTPLHVAKDAKACRLLLDAGAPPIALDPRQPDPSKYLRSRGCYDVRFAADTHRTGYMPVRAVCKDRPTTLLASHPLAGCRRHRALAHGAPASALSRAVAR